MTWASPAPHSRQSVPPPVCQPCVAFGQQCRTARGAQVTGRAEMPSKADGLLALWLLEE